MAWRRAGRARGRGGALHLLHPSAWLVAPAASASRPTSPLSRFRRWRFLRGLLGLAGRLVLRRRSTPVGGSLVTAHVEGVLVGRVLLRTTIIDHEATTGGGNGSGDKRLRKERARASRIGGEVRPRLHPKCRRLHRHPNLGCLLLLLRLTECSAAAREGVPRAAPQPCGGGGGGGLGLCGRFSSSASSPS